ncbi:hypothetical protein BDR26DRAFT_875113 [Obelidium mucronatum]|nr:hypothetical protein BDR26DRAFT_875113 [Obelidium mucronatum]
MNPLIYASTEGHEPESVDNVQYFTYKSVHNGSKKRYLSWQNATFVHDRDNYYHVMDTDGVVRFQLNNCGSNSRIEKELAKKFPGEELQPLPFGNHYKVVLEIKRGPHQGVPLSLDGRIADPNTNPVFIEFDLTQNNIVPVSLLEAYRKELDDGQYTVTAEFGEPLLEPESQVTETVSGNTGLTTEAIDKVFSFKNERVDGILFKNSDQLRDFSEHCWNRSQQQWIISRRLEGNVISPSLLSNLIGLIKETSVQTLNELENRRIGRWNPDMKSVDDIINVQQMREENDELVHEEIGAVDKGEKSNESLMSQNLGVGLGLKYAKDKTNGTQKDTSKHHGSTLAGSGSVGGFGVKAKGSGTHSHDTKKTKIDNRHNADVSEVGSNFDRNSHQLRQNAFQNAFFKGNTKAGTNQHRNVKENYQAGFVKLPTNSVYHVAYREQYHSYVSGSASTITTEKKLRPVFVKLTPPAKNGLKDLSRQGTFQLFPACTIKAETVDSIRKCFHVTQPFTLFAQIHTSILDHRKPSPGDVVVLRRAGNFSSCREINKSLFSENKVFLRLDDVLWELLTSQQMQMPNDEFLVEYESEMQTIDDSKIASMAVVYTQRCATSVFLRFRDGTREVFGRPVAGADAVTQYFGGPFKSIKVSAEPPFVKVVSGNSASELPRPAKPAPTLQKTDSLFRAFCARRVCEALQGVPWLKKDNMKLAQSKLILRVLEIRSRQLCLGKKEAKTPTNSLAATAWNELVIEQVTCAAKKFMALDGLREHFDAVLQNEIEAAWSLCGVLSLETKNFAKQLVLQLCADYVDEANIMVLTKEVTEAMPKEEAVGQSESQGSSPSTAATHIKETQETLEEMIVEAVSSRMMSFCREECPKCGSPCLQLHNHLDNHKCLHQPRGVKGSHYYAPGFNLVFGRLFSRHNHIIDSPCNMCELSSSCNGWDSEFDEGLQELLTSFYWRHRDALVKEYRTSFAGGNWAAEDSDGLLLAQNYEKLKEKLSSEHREVQFNFSKFRVLNEK